MNQMVTTIKEVHDVDVCMFKMGNFYHVFGKDADILSYILGYKIKETQDGNKECGFPLSAISKVASMLENLHINYLVIDRRNNYDVDKRSDNKDLNKYNEYYIKGNRYVNIKRRIEYIHTILINSIQNDNSIQIVKQIEDILYERRKV